MTNYIQVQTMLGRLAGIRNQVDATGEAVRDGQAPRAAELLRSMEGAVAGLIQDMEPGRDDAGCVGGTGPGKSSPGRAVSDDLRRCDG